MPSSQQMRNMVIAVLALLLIWGLLAYATHEFLLKYETLFDLFPRWYGAREMLRGANPYDITITPDLLESEGYGEYASPQYFLYPATITYLLLPLWVLPFPIAMSIWGGLQLLIVLLLPLVVFLQLEWRISPPLLVGVIFLSSFGYYHAMVVYNLGQFTLFALACVVIAWLALRAGREWAVALALLGPPIRPEGIAITAALLLLLLIHRRWRIVLIWGGIMAALFAISVLQIGFWPTDYLDGIRHYRDIRDSDAPSEFAGMQIITALLTVGVLAWSAWLLRPIIRRTTPEAFLWSSMVVIVAALLVLPQSGAYTLVYLLLPLWVLWYLGRGNPRHSALVAALMLLPWTFKLVGAQIDMNLARTEQIALPLLVGALLTWHWRRTLIADRPAHDPARHLHQTPESRHTWR